MVSESKRRIEVAAAGLLARHGYHGFGLKKLSEAAGLPYGSIYHHFPGGKEEIAVSAITGTGVLVGRMISEAPADVFGTAATLFDFMAAKLAASEWTDGCPVGTPALDGGSDVEAVRTACVAAFDAMTAGFTQLLTDMGLPAGSPMSCPPRSSPRTRARHCSPEFAARTSRCSPSPPPWPA